PRSSTATTSPSGPRAVRPRTRIFTLSPCIAAPIASGGMKTSSPVAGARQATKPKPRGCTVRSPSRSEVARPRETYGLGARTAGFSSGAGPTVYPAGSFSLKRSPRALRTPSRLRLSRSRSSPRWSTSDTFNREAISRTCKGRESVPRRSRISARVGRRVAIGPREVARLPGRVDRSSRLQDVVTIPTEPSMSSPPGPRPASGLLFWASLAPVLAGLAASAALAVDYAHTGAPVFCAEGGGCDALRQTILAEPFGVPLPRFGLAGFALLALAVLVPGRRARLVQTGLASIAAVVGA